MLKKIISVKNVGQFLDASTEKQELTQFVLISAGNGYGKTTLCNILHSLQTNDPSYIRSRKSLQSAKEKESEEREVSLLFNNKNVVFKNEWKVKEGDQDKDIKELDIGQNLLIHVFNDTYITTNICSNTEINPRHRLNLLSTLSTLATTLIPIDSSYNKCIDWLKEREEKSSTYVEKKKNLL